MFFFELIPTQLQFAIEKRLWWDFIHDFVRQKAEIEWVEIFIYELHQQQLPES